MGAGVWGEDGLDIPSRNALSSQPSSSRRQTPAWLGLDAQHVLPLHGATEWPVETGDAGDDVLRATQTCMVRLSQLSIGR